MINILKKRNNTDKPKILSLPLYMIAPSPYQPRRYFDPGTMEELKNSILEFGVVQPITVRRDNGEYEIIAGERRFRAAQMAGLDEIPAYVINADDDTSAILALLENLQREDLSFFEIAESYKNLIRNQEITPEELSGMIGKSQSSVSGKIRLLRLPPLVKKLIRDYDLTERQAKALLLLPGSEEQLEAVKLICRDNLSETQTEELVREIRSGRMEITDMGALSKSIRRAELLPHDDRKPEPDSAYPPSDSSDDSSNYQSAVQRAVNMMRENGIETSIEENKFEYGTEYIIRGMTAARDSGQ